MKKLTQISQKAQKGARSLPVFIPLHGEGLGVGFPSLDSLSGVGRRCCGWTFFLFSFLFSLFFSSCRDKSVFTLKGDIDHLQQAYFYIYATDGSMQTVDTLQVVEGQFTWKLSLQQDAQLHIVYPNLSEQVIFASPGESVLMKGDAGQLRSISVKGTPDNDELTDFRLAHLTDTPDSLRRAMRAYAEQHPDSRVGLYLRRQLLLLQQQTSRFRKGQKLPALTLPPDGLTSSSDTLRLRPGKRPLLLVFWASWKRDSRDHLPDVRRCLQRTGNKPDSLRLQAVSVSLDYDLNLYAYSLRTDSIDYDRRCYRQIWETPLCRELDITDIPYFILTDHRFRILAEGTDWKEQIQPELDKFLREK